jgi:1-acyl-sn-glycerol-3-phosphate acyltransferase
VTRWLAAFLRRVLRIFFRRIEVEGAERVPASGPVIFAVNHPNALVDPLILICFAPRPVVFLAKAPLFRMPVVGAVTRALGSIPVHRRQDSAADLAKNRETFAHASEVLAGGGAVAIFPEGVSHDEPRLMPLKTGAARIALEAAARARASIDIVCAGLYYTWKRTFRSSVLLSFGETIRVALPPTDAAGEPAPASVRELTAAIERAIAAQTVQVETREAADLVRRAEKIFSADLDSAEAPIFQERELRRRFAEGWRRLSERDPARLEAIQTRIARFEAERRASGLRLEHLTPEALDAKTAAALLARSAADLALAPVALVGVLVHYPAYRLVGSIAKIAVKEQEDVVATAKILAAAALFPLTWLLAAAAVEKLAGPWPAAATLVCLPLCGAAALRLAETLDEVAGRARAWIHWAFSGYALRRLLAERRAIREEMIKIAEELEIGETFKRPLDDS